MPRYRVTLHTHAWAYIEVEADDETNAIDAAYEAQPDICAQCSGWGQDGLTLELGDEWDTVDQDGKDIPVELVDAMTGEEGT